MKYYIIFFVSTALIFNWRCIFNLGRNQITRKCNMFHHSYSVVYLLQTEWNKIFTMWDSMCCNLKWGLFRSTVLITLKTDGNPSCFMLEVELTALWQRILVLLFGITVLTKSWIECYAILSLNSTLKHQISGVIRHPRPIKCLQNMTDIAQV